MSWSVWTVFSDLDHCQGHFMAKSLFCWRDGVLACWLIALKVVRCRSDPHAKGENRLFGIVVVAPLCL